MITAHTNANILGCICAILGFHPAARWLCFKLVIHKSDIKGGKICTLTEKVYLAGNPLFISVVTPPGYTTAVHGINNE